METVPTCPLGSTCEEAKDGKVYRCRWLLRMGKADENGQIQPGSEYDECALVLQSVHLTELKKGTRGVQASVEGLRNIVEKTQPVVVYPRGKGNGGKGQLKGPELGGSAKLIRDSGGLSGDQEADGGAGEPG